MARSTKKVIITRDVHFNESAPEVHGANKKEKPIVRFRAPDPVETIVFV